MAYADEVLADSPAGYWKLDETSGTTAADSSGNGIDGTYNGSPSLASRSLNSALGSVADFDGTNDYVSIPVGIGNTSGGLTVEGWVIADSINNGMSMLTEVYTGSGDIIVAEVGINPSGSGNTARWGGADYSGASWRQITDTTNASTATLYHLAMTVTSGNVGILYVNGSQVATGTIGARNDDNGWKIGTRHDSALSPWFDGAIGHVAIYKSVLSSTRIADHYNAATSGIELPLSPATITITPAAPAVDTGAVELALTPATVTVTPQAPTINAGIVLNLSPATVTITPQAPGLTLSGVALALTPATITVTPQSLAVVDDGTITLALSPAVITVTPQAAAFDLGLLTISGAGVFDWVVVPGGMLSLASDPAPDDTGFVTVSSTGTVVASLASPIAADFEPMWNDAGSGSVTYELDDEDITYGDVVRCYYKGRAAFSWIATERIANTVPAGGSEAPSVTWTGPGWITETSAARVRPSRGFGASPVEETRSFGWTSVTYDDASWGADSISLGEMGTPTAYWYGVANYPDAETEWMWTPPGSTSWAPTGDVYFRKDFEVDTAGSYQIAFVADDRGELYIDGQRLLTTGNWDNSTASIHTQDVVLSAGDHTIAVWAQNNPGEPGNNPAGVLVSVIGEGSIGTILRSGAGWKCRAYPLVPPGVTVADAFITILDEAQDDGVLPNLSLSFDEYTDSNGTPWPYLADVAAPVGSDLWSFIKRHAGIDIDVRMRPGAEIIDAWVAGYGGTSRAITLHTPTDADDPYSGNLMSLEHQGQAARANAAVVRWAKGWKYVATGATPVTEIELDLGHITVEAEAERIALAELATLSTTREQITATVDVRDDEWPWHHYQEGDIINVPDSSGTPTEQRIVALAARIEDDEVTITPTLSDRIAEDVERHENWLKAMADGASRGNTGTVSPPKLGPPSYAPPAIKQQTWSLPVWSAKSGGVFPAPTRWTTRRISFNLDEAATGTRTAAVKVNGSAIATLTLTSGQQSTYVSLVENIDVGDQVSITTTGSESFGGNVTLEYSTR